MNPNSSFSLNTRPCLIDLGRFRWDIYDRDSLYESSAESYATEDEAIGARDTKSLTRHNALAWLSDCRSRSDPLTP
jgi:hypothetical protein